MIWIMICLNWDLIRLDTEISQVITPLKKSLKFIWNIHLANFTCVVLNCRHFISTWLTLMNTKSINRHKIIKLENNNKNINECLLKSYFLKSCLINLSLRLWPHCWIINLFLFILFIHQLTDLKFTSKVVLLNKVKCSWWVERTRQDGALVPDRIKFESYIKSK